MQYIIKDGRGKAIQSRANFPNYTNVARELMIIKATLPFTVWKLDTIRGSESYDSERTRRLSEGVRMVQAESPISSGFTSARTSRY